MRGYLGENRYLYSETEDLTHQWFNAVSADIFLFAAIVTHL